MRYASAELRGDRKIILGVATGNPHGVQLADKASQADFKVLVTAGLRALRVYEFASADWDVDQGGAKTGASLSFSVLILP